MSMQTEVASKCCQDRLRHLASGWDPLYLFIYVEVYLLLFIELLVSTYYYSHAPFLFR